MCVCVFMCRSEPVGGNREWSDAVGSQRSGESLPSDQPTALPADGRSGGTQRPGHYIRYAHTKRHTNTHRHSSTIAYTHMLKMVYLGLHNIFYIYFSIDITLRRSVGIHFYVRNGRLIDATHKICIPPKKMYPK